MGSSLYPLSPELRAYYEAIAASAEPLDDVDDDEYILDDRRVRDEKSARVDATNARFVLRQDDEARTKLEKKKRVKSSWKSCFFHAQNAVKAEKAAVETTADGPETEESR